MAEYLKCPGRGHKTHAHGPTHYDASLNDLATWLGNVIGVSDAEPPPGAAATRCVCVMCGIFHPINGGPKWMQIVSAAEAFSTALYLLKYCPCPLALISRATATICSKFRKKTDEKIAALTQPRRHCLCWLRVQQKKKRKCQEICQKIRKVKNRAALGSLREICICCSYFFMWSTTFANN